MLAVFLYVTHVDVGKYFVKIWNSLPATVEDFASIRQFKSLQYNTIQYNTIQYNTIQYNAMQNIYNAHKVE